MALKLESGVTGFHRRPELAGAGGERERGRLARGRRSSRPARSRAAAPAPPEHASRLAASTREVAAALLNVSARTAGGETEGVHVSCHPRPLYPFDNGSVTWSCDVASPCCDRRTRMAPDGRYLGVRYHAARNFDMCEECVKLWRVDAPLAPMRHQGQGSRRVHPEVQ